MESIEIDENNPCLESTSFVPSFDENGEINVSHLIYSFQELASRQIDRLGLGEDFEKENDFLYVVLRYKGYFLKPFCRNGKYRLFTYPMQATALQLYRYAYVLDENGEVVFYLISLWVMVDSHNRKIKSARPFRSRIKEIVPEIEDVKPLTEESLSNFSLDGIPFVRNSEYEVEKEDIDSNGHMNNTVYIRIVQPSLEGKRLYSFEFDYEKECFLSERLLISSHHEDDVIYLKGEKEDSSLSFKSKFIFVNS